MRHNAGFKSIVVVGAGPSGLLLSLLCARADIPVTLLDAGSELDKSPRATHYAPPAVYELRRAGVIDDVRAGGFIPRTVCWRKFVDREGSLNSEMLAGLDGSVLDGTPDRMACLPLNALGQILLTHLERRKEATIYWAHKVTEIGEENGKAWVEAETKDGKKRFEADYVVGCDGANSIVRRRLFGDLEFPGKTWDEQIVATNTYYPFEKFGYEDANFIIDKEHWHMASRISKDGMWRVTYGEIPGLTFDQLKERQSWKFENILPGRPKADSGAYKIVNFAPYKVHQRLAPSMRKGRFLLGADAAHLCNPFGGLGLTGGMVDIGNLYDCLYGIYNNFCNESILDKYSEVRREKYSTIIDPVSSDNLQRMYQDPEKALETDEFLKLAKRTATDTEFSKQVQESVNGIKYDFTQHYTQPEKQGKADMVLNMKSPNVTVAPTAGVD